MPATTSTSLFYGDRAELGDFKSKVTAFNSFQSNVLALNPLLIFYSRLSITIFSFFYVELPSFGMNENR